MRRFARFLLRVSPIKKPRELGTSTKWIVDTFRRAHSVCPSCGATNTLEIVSTDLPGTGAVEADKRVVCTACGDSEDISQILDRAASRVDVFRGEERTYLFAGIGFFAFIALLSLTTGNALTFVCGALISLVLILKGVVARYQAWQILNRRILEGRAAVKDWLRYELRSPKT